MLLSFADFFFPIFWALHSYLVTWFGFLQIAPSLLSIKSIKIEGWKKKKKNLKRLDEATHSKASFRIKMMQNVW